MLKLTKDGTLCLESPIYYMQRMNLDSNFEAGETFLTGSPWSGKRLPEEWLERIGHYKAECLSARVRTPRAGVEPADVARLCAAYRGDKTYTSRPFLTRILQSAATLSISIR
jgi:hypothetical protein